MLQNTSESAASGLSKHPISARRWAMGLEMKLEPFELPGGAPSFGDALGATAGGLKMMRAKDQENRQTTTTET